MTRKRRLRFAYSISASWVITKHFRLILIKSTFSSLISDSLLLALRNLKFLVFSHASACTHIIFKWSSASLTSLLTEICVEWENFFYTRWLLFNLLLLKEILRVQVKKKSSTIEDTHRSLISISLSSFNLILISSNWLFFLPLLASRSIHLRIYEFFVCRNFLSFTWHSLFFVYMFDDVWSQKLYKYMLVCDI